jgi:hypothetical protein
MNHDDRSYWLDEPGNQKKVFWALCVICAVVAAAELVVHRHPHFSWEGFPFFYCIFGFIAFWCVVIAGKHLRKILWRPEDYYD